MLIIGINKFQNKQCDEYINLISNQMQMTFQPLHLFFECNDRHSNSNIMRNKIMKSVITYFCYRLSTFAAIYTFMYGLNTCFGIPAIVEVHGNKQLALIYGLQLLSYGMGNSVGTPIAGITTINVNNFLEVVTPYTLGRQPWQ